MSNAAQKNLSDLESKLAETQQNLSQFCSKGIEEFSPAAMLAFETELLRLNGLISALLLAIFCQKQALSEEEAKEELALAKRCKGKYRDMGWRPHQIKAASGDTVVIFARYFARKCAPGKGFSPFLLLSGLSLGTSPKLAALIAMFAASLSSYEEAKAALQEVGPKLDPKTIKRIADAFGASASARRALLVDKEAPEVAEGDGKLRRVLISTDGGRIRIRRAKPGRKGKKGRSRYYSEWREPKLVIIVFLDENGRQLANTPPIIDTTLSGPDAAFALLHSYLERLDRSNTIFTFVSDGARWIWARTCQLLKSLGIKEKDCVQTLDFYHAVEHLSNFANLKAKWTEQEKKAWVNRMKKWLKLGKAAELVEELRKQAKYSRCHGLTTEVKFFEAHLPHLAYNKSRDLGLPIGSGAVESAVRRVLNLKLKGPGLHWSEQGASNMLILRSFFKAGRWGNLVKTVFKVTDCNDEMICDY